VKDLNRIFFNQVNLIRSLNDCDCTAISNTRFGLPIFYKLRDLKYAFTEQRLSDGFMEEESENT